MSTKNPEAANRREAKHGRQAILVLGMHRSGTSAISRVMNLLGATAPKTLLPEAPDNPRGHWESALIYELNKQFLDSIGSYWHDWRNIDPDQMGNSNARQFKDKLKVIIIAEYGNSPLIFIKDPRICRLLPFWLTVLKERNIDPLAILALRNPLEVALSLHRRNSLTPSKSYLSWLRHVFEAERFSRQLPRMFVQYDKLLSDWRAHLFPGITKIGVAWPELTQSTKLEIDRFLSLDLRHENATIPDLAAHPDVTSWVVQTYDVLLELAEDDQNPLLFRKIDAIRATFDEACRSFSDILRTEELAGEQQRALTARLRKEAQGQQVRIAELGNATHERDAEIIRIKTSASWRLTEPLRRAGYVFSRLLGQNSPQKFRAALRHPFSSPKRKVYREYLKWGVSPLTDR